VSESVQAGLEGTFRILSSGLTRFPLPGVDHAGSMINNDASIPSDAVFRSGGLMAPCLATQSSSDSFTMEDAVSRGH
jgi:hypothetical protein